MLDTSDRNITIIHGNEGDRIEITKYIGGYIEIAITESDGNEAEIHIHEKSHLTALINWLVSQLENFP